MEEIHSYNVTIQYCMFSRITPTGSHVASQLFSYVGEYAMHCIGLCLKC